MHSYKIIAIFLLSFCSTSNTNLFAQKDTAFVSLETTDYTLGFSTRYRQYKVGTNFIRDNQKNPYKLVKNDISIGLRIRYKALNLAIIYGIHDLYTDQFVTPGLINIDVKLYPERFFIKYNLHWGSLEQSLPDVVFNIGKSRQDSRIITTSLWGAYIWNYKKLSLSSSYSFVEKQKKSAGSWISTGFTEYNHFNVQPDAVIQAFPDTASTFKKLDEFRLGIGGGYTYSLVWKNLVLNGIVSGNVELTTIDVTSTDNTISPFASLAFNPFLKVNASAMYYFGKNYVALLFEHYPRKTARLLNEYDKRYWWLRFSYGYKF